MVGLVAVDFTQRFTFRAVFPIAELVLLRFEMAAPTNAPASAPTVVAPTILVVRFSPFPCFELPRVVLDMEFLDFIAMSNAFM